MSSEVLEYKIRTVHNGAGKAYTKMEVECNAYCKPPVHCDVWYNQFEEADKETFLSVLQMNLGRTVTILEVRRTYEALPEPPEAYVGYGERKKGEPMNAWLVFWQL